MPSRTLIRSVVYFTTGALCEELLKIKVKLLDKRTYKFPIQNGCRTIWSDATVSTGLGAIQLARCS